jgi:hypothetical protein
VSIEIHVRTELGGTEPLLFCDPARFGQLHHPIKNFPE